MPQATSKATVYWCRLLFDLFTNGKASLGGLFALLFGHLEFGNACTSE